MTQLAVKTLEVMKVGSNDYQYFVNDDFNFNGLQNNRNKTAYDLCMQKMILQGTGNVQSRCIFWIQVSVFGQELPQSPSKKSFSP